MKISVYTTKIVHPKNSEEYELFCDIFNTPSLKNGYVEVLGECISEITKKEYNKAKKVYARFYNLDTESWVEGSLIFLNESQKTFVTL